jgi:hypothetical protein
MKKLRLKVNVTVSYNKKVAIRFHKTEYYKAMAMDIKILPNKDKEKRKFAGIRRKSVSDRIEFFKAVDYTSSWKVQLGIFKKRQRMVNGLMPHRKAGQLMSILTNVDFLATCYKNVKRKRGAMTPASSIPLKQQKTRKGDQKTYIKATKFAPDGMSSRIFRLTAHLLKYLKKGDIHGGLVDASIFQNQELVMPLDLLLYLLSWIKLFKRE